MGFLSGLFGGGGKAQTVPQTSTQMEIEQEQLSALKDLRALKTPSIESLIPTLQEFVLADIITPEEAEQFILGETLLSQVEVDPELRAAQTEVMAKLQEIADEGGLTAIDRARINEIRNEINQVNRGSQQAIMMDAQARGISGSGMEMASRMMAQQGSIDRAANADVDIAAEAQRRALEALAGRADIASQLEQRDLSADQLKATQQDAIEEFNQRLRLGVRENQANQNQRISDMNTDVANQQQSANIGAVQQNYTNKLNKATGALGGANQVANSINTDVANRYGAGNQAQANSDNGMGNMLAIAGTVASFFSDEDLKENMEEPSEFDIDAFLSSIDPMTFEYKDDPNNSSQLGISAQELEKGPAQGAVIEIDGHKAIDTDQIVGSLLATAKKMDERLKRIESRS